MAAFNQGDARAVAALWTENGDYSDESGTTYSGRAAIEAAYQQFFAEHPGAKLRIVVDSVRLLSDSTAIEDGRAIVELPSPSAPGSASYTAVHVKVQDQWRMATVRDTRSAPSPAASSTADLGWLIGAWVAEEHGTRSESTCRWVADQSFVERSHVTTHVDGSTSSGVQLIGWNPQRGCVQSWDFSSGGGLAVGVWEPKENGWQAEVEGTLSNGTPTTAVNVLTRLDDQAYVWQSVRRAVGGVAIPDTDEVVLRRQAVQR